MNRWVGYVFFGGVVVLGVVLAANPSFWERPMTRGLSELLGLSLGSSGVFLILFGLVVLVSIYLRHRRETK